MKTLQIASLSVVLLGSGLARAQEDDTAMDAQAPAIEPATPQPAAPPPPPQAMPSAPTQAPMAQAAVSPATPPGQWVYTQQNGWVWMPYGNAYTSTTTDESGVPYEYLYQPSYGWSWV